MMDIYEIDRHIKGVLQRRAGLYPEKPPPDPRWRPEIILRNGRCVCGRPVKFKRCCGVEMVG